MDINDLRVAVTIFSLLVFLGIVAWAFAGRNREQLESLGKLPFIDGEAPDTAAKNTKEGV